MRRNYEKGFFTSMYGLSDKGGQSFQKRDKLLKVGKVSGKKMEGGEKEVLG
jgi:hypothetical protein